MTIVETHPLAIKGGMVTHRPLSFSGLWLA